MVDDAQLAGYVLEELLASLLQDSGYELLSSAADDPETLLEEGNGLVVRGRGCTHQVDALGTLNTPVPFGLPLRLFVEAKHRTSQPVGIDVVRNAFGVLADVNQHCPANSSTRRVAYQYSLVSTRGFTKHAVAYARTHGIALHDFSGDAWQAVRDTVDLAVGAFTPLLEGAGAQKAVPLSSLRRLLRAALATLQRSHDDSPSAAAAFDEASIARRVRAEVARGPVKGTIAPAQVKSLVPLLVGLAQRHDRSLLIGYPDGQLLLALRPDQTDRDLDTLLAKHARTVRGVQVVRVRLAFSSASVPGELPGGEGDAGDWVVEPEDRSGDFRLRVGLPQGLERTLLTTDGAAVTTGERTGTIAIYRHGTPYRLEFALEVRTGSPEDDDTRPSLRSQRAEEALAITPAAQAPEGRGRGAARRADAPPPPASAPAQARPRRADRPVPVDAPAAEPAEEDTSWDDDEVKALLVLLEQQATAALGKRRSSTLEDKRQAAEGALGLLHALAKARGELSREEVCQRLGTDPGQRFSRRAGAVTSATKTLKDRGVVATSRADVLVSERKGRRAGSNGVTHVHVRAEFVKPLRSQARRLAQAQQSTPAQVGVKSSTASRASAAVPRQRTRAAVTR